MVRALPPWFENVKKRQVKSPKVYLRDSGILLWVVYPGDESYDLDVTVRPSRGRTVVRIVLGGGGLVTPSGM